MANHLPRERQLRVLAALVEGNSERAVARMTDVNARTVGRFALAVGQGAARLHDRLVRDLSCAEIEVDEFWSYLHKKQARVTDDDPAWMGDVYTFVGLGRSSRLCIAYRAGKREQETADLFIADLRARLRTMPQLLASDGLVAYVRAIGASFGPACSYAQLVKNVTPAGTSRADPRSEPPREPFLIKRVIYGTPDVARVTTAHIERNHATMRHHIGRVRRLCYAFSKRPENHEAAMALGYAWYNLGTLVRTLRVTPAMAAGLTDHVWELEEFLEAVLTAPSVAPPQPKPLLHVPPNGPARQLPNGRGFLRLLPGGAARSMPSEPSPSSGGLPAAAASAPADSDSPASPSAPREPVQLDLFDDLGDPPKKLS